MPERSQTPLGLAQSLAVGRRAARLLAEALGPTAFVTCRGPRASRRIALTFDDGPAALTRGYLELLDAFGVRATFFVVGELCAARPHDLDEIVRRGHEVAGHGYSHRAFTTLSQRELEAELERTAALLPKGDAPAMQLVRPPHGALSLGSLMVCRRAGFYPVLWSRDSDDCRTSSSDVIVSALCDKPLRPGDIVLMHEGQPWTMRALEPILRHLISEGHELTTVGDLLSA